MPVTYAFHFKKVFSSVKSGALMKSQFVSGDNAVMHRDYTYKGRSVFIKASPEEFVIEAPVPPGIHIRKFVMMRGVRETAG